MHVGLTRVVPTGNSILMLLLLAAVFTGVPCELQAAIYRWVDAAGREHFTMDLNQVPPQHRAAAEAAEKRSHSRMNVVGDSSSGSGENGGAPPARRAMPTGRRLDRPEPGGHAEGWWRAEHQRRLNDVERAQKAVEQANDIHQYSHYYEGTTKRERAKARSAAKRARAAAVKRAEEQLRTAEKMLAEFVEAARRAAVPPGWLR